MRAAIVGSLRIGRISEDAASRMSHSSEEHKNAALHHHISDLLKSPPQCCLLMAAFDWDGLRDLTGPGSGESKPSELNPWCSPGALSSGDKHVGIRPYSNIVNIVLANTFLCAHAATLVFI